jgi:hypothetical protein
MGIEENQLYTTEETRIFFSHIPKCGGSSIQAFLSNQFPILSICPHIMPIQLALDGNLSQYRLFQGHIHYGLVEILPKTDVISFFREPVSRTLSLLLHLRRSPDFHPLHHKAKDKSISEMLCDKDIVKKFSNQQTAYLGTQLQFEKMLTETKSPENLSQMINFLTPPSIELALKRLHSLALIGLTEDIEESLNRLCQQYAFHPILDCFKHNQAPASDTHLIADLSKRDLEKLRAMNNLDTELYEAAKSLFYQKPKAFTFDYLAHASLQKQKLPLTEDNILDLNAPLVGTNWYMPEKNSSETAFRWSGPTVKSSIEFPTWIEDYDSMQVEVFSQTYDDIKNTLKIYLNGDLIAPLAEQTTPQNLTFLFKVNSNLLSQTRGFHQLIFIHEADDIPLPDNGDIRTLHFVLSRIKFISDTKLLPQY